MYPCSVCGRSYGSEESLSQHQRDSPGHPGPFSCRPCNRYFKTAGALAQHQRDSPSNHQIAPETLPPTPPASEPTPPPQTKRKKPQKRPQETRSSFTFPKLHSRIVAAVVPDLSSPRYQEPSSRSSNNEKPTKIMGTFLCNTPSCNKKSWASKIVAIVIRGYPNNGYSAVVYNQRCKRCDQLGELKLDEESYVERVAYRLKKWGGAYVPPQPFEKKKGPEHEWRYCEGCKIGVCRQLKIERDYAY